MVNRGITLLRNYSPLVYMGGAAVSSLPDIARPIMTEGINAFMGTSLRLFMGGMRKRDTCHEQKTVREVGEARYGTVNESICYGRCWLYIWQSKYIGKKRQESTGSFLPSQWPEPVDNSNERVHWSYCYKTHDSSYG